MPTEDWVLSDPEPDPPNAINRFAPYRPSKPVEEPKPLPSQAIPTKRRFPSPIRCTRREDSSSEQSAHEYYRDLPTPTMSSTSDWVSRDTCTPSGQMLDSRGRCYKFALTSTCQGLWDQLVSDDSDLSDGSLRGSGRKRDSSSSSDSVFTSLPSLANFNSLSLTPSTCTGDPAPSARGTQSADIFRNHVKPISKAHRRSSRSLDDVRQLHPLSSVVGNFAVVRSPNKLTPPPRRRDHRVGQLFCLPNCFASFDRALIH